MKQLKFIGMVAAGVIAAGFILNLAIGADVPGAENARDGLGG